MRPLLALAVALILSSSSFAGSLNIRKDSSRLYQAAKNLAYRLVDAAIVRQQEAVILEAHNRRMALADRMRANPAWPSPDLREQYDREDRQIKEEERREVERLSEILLEYR